MRKEPKQFKSKIKFKENAPDPEIEVLRGQLARALADYDNLVKRVEREKLERAQSANLKLILKLFPVLDMLYEAQKHLNDSGIALTIKEFEDTLKLEGIETICPEVGEEFTEDLHEAIDTVSVEGLKDNQISECVMRGWRFTSGQVIRHAKVKVNKN